MTGAAGIITALNGEAVLPSKETVKGNGGLPTTWSIQAKSRNVLARNELVGSVVRLMDNIL